MSLMLWTSVWMVRMVLVVLMRMRMRMRMEMRIQLQLLGRVPDHLRASTRQITCVGVAMGLGLLEREQRGGKLWCLR